ncbi:hypothetical protein D9613_003155 [Agrocybe pediades]|uniref:RRN6 K-rich C-terminal domain-containing protein n=1 Tax=Agrocybe pediades TaxID=84607 RepID=A0A8H4VLG2_9AGAR|nr:hypothetical protein D9613_003155 [Agrocybe pediades]
MAFWPRDERTKSKPAKRNAHEKEWNRDYPNLEPGLIGAATLVEDSNKRLNWAFVATPPQNAKDLNPETRLRAGKHTTVFPPTCSTPAPRKSGSVQQSAEQGANFLRTFLPDVEIASELIRDRLIEETAIARELEQFDPYLGNLLDYTEAQSNENHVSLFFPTGETNRDLCSTFIKYASDSEIVFTPFKENIYTFPTPIQHIVASRRGPNLAVRTFGSTQLFRLKFNGDASSKPSLVGLATITRQETANEVTVDMKHTSMQAEMLLIGEKGTVSKCTIANGGKQIVSLGGNRLPSKQTSDGFWRISTGDDHSSLFVLSKKNLWQTDVRAPSSLAEFHSLPSGKQCFTSIEDYQNDYILRMSSTKQIIWMDVRFPKQPLLAYAHERDYDRYLSISTITKGFRHPLTFLTSRNNSLTTVYDVSCSLDQRIQLKALPYLLPSESTMYGENNGRQFITHDKALGMVRYSDRDGVEYTEITRDGCLVDHTYAVENKEVFETMKILEERFEDVGPLGRKEFAEANLSGAYNAIFRRHFDEAKKFEEENAESFYELLESFPSYMQRKEAPTEHILSTYDVMFRAGDEPPQVGRSDFLTTSIVNSKRGFRALKQGRLSGELVQAPLHRSIAPALRSLDKKFPTDPTTSMEYLQSFNLADDVDCSVQAREFERESCQQLAVDLALSADIYSDVSVVKAEPVDQTLELMTEALSLGNEPPLVEFRFLRPLEKISAYSEDKTTFSKAPELPIGVRLLLKDWDNADPEDYVYRDPYDLSSSTASSAIPLPKMPRQPGQPPIITQSQSQKPPTIMASSAATALKPEPNPRKATAQVQSQDRFASNMVPGFGSTRLDRSMINSSQPPPQTQSQSQEMFASTQVLPGPHGGRPSMPKKKPVKKRLGGF